jgi:hypothetical protein
VSNAASETKPSIELRGGLAKLIEVRVPVDLGTIDLVVEIRALQSCSSRVLSPASSD